MTVGRHKTRVMGFKTARRKCEGENSTVNRMNSTVLYRKNVLTEKTLF